MDPEQPRVLVVGAGPAGLTLALSLLHHGISVRVIDMSKDTNPGQRGPAIWPRTLEVLQSLGLSHEVQRLCYPIPKIRVYELPGGIEVAKEVDLITHTEATSDRPFPNGIFLGQNNLEGMLANAIIAKGGIIDRGVKFTALEQTADFVNVTLDHQTESGKLESATYEYAIGADGGRSLVRKALELPFIGETREDTTVVFGDYYMSGLCQEYNHLWGDFLTNGAFVRPSKTPGLFSLIMGANVEEYTAAEDKTASVKAMFKKTIGGREDVQILEVVWQGLYKFNMRMVPQLSKGRVFLAGDAAHVHSPTGGQGLNTGIQDAYNLAWKLALVLKGQAPPYLLKTYSSERIPVITEMLNITTRIFNKTVDVASRRPDDPHILHRGGVLNQLGVNYRMSDIVMDDGDAAERVGAYGGSAGGVVRAGDRAPDASGLLPLGVVGPVPKRLFEIFNYRAHTVLVFAGRLGNESKQLLDSNILKNYPPTLVQLVILQPADATIDFSNTEINNVWFEDRDGHTYDSYKTDDSSGKIFVIRPDGYVGARLSNLEGIGKYFEVVFL